MRVNRIAILAAVVGLTLGLAGCSSSVTSIAVTGQSPAVGATSQMDAVATLDDGSTQDVTSTATWTTSNTAIATISSTGLVTGTGVGTVVITATYKNVAGTTELNVISAPVTGRAH